MGKAASSTTTFKVKNKRGACNETEQNSGQGGSRRQRPVAVIGEHLRMEMLYAWAWRTE